MLYMPPKLPQQNIRGLNRLTPTLRIYTTAQVQVSTSVSKKQLSVLRHLIVCSRTTPLDITLGYNNALSLTLSSPRVKPGVGLDDPHSPFQLRICYACDHPNARFRGQILLTLMPPSTNPPCCTCTLEQLLRTVFLLELHQSQHLTLTTLAMPSWRAAAEHSSTPKCNPNPSLSVKTPGFLDVLQISVLVSSFQWWQYQSWEFLHYWQTWKKLSPSLRQLFALISLLLCWHFVCLHEWPDTQQVCLHLSRYLQKPWHELFLTYVLTH